MASDLFKNFFNKYPFGALENNFKDKVTEESL